jgi:membrane dipeptidase
MPESVPESVPESLLIVDGHLDLALNDVRQLIDHTRPIHELRGLEIRESQQAMTSIPEFTRGNVALVFGTLYAEPADLGFAAAAISKIHHGYSTPEGAEAQALEQLAVYERWAAAGLIRLITSRAVLEDHLQRFAHDRVPGLLVLMEGADPIKTVSDLELWWARGVRAIGLTWGRTRYAGGTGSPGGLTPEGRELLKAMRQRGVILDTSHLAEQAFYEALEFYPDRLMASHSNPRALLNAPGIDAVIPADRHLSDEMIQAIGARGGMIGLNLINFFLEPRWTMTEQSLRVSIFDQCRRMLEHTAALIGWDKVGIGSDLDAGMSLDCSPLELDTIADFSRFAEVVPEAARAGVVGQNWLRFLWAALP